MIVERIMQFIDYKGLSKLKFYNQVGLSNGFLDKVKDIGASKIQKILGAYPEINPMWLITGVGEMLKSDIKVYDGRIFPEPGFVYEPVKKYDAAPLYDEEEVEEFTNKSGNTFYVYPDGNIKIEVPLMTEPAYASHIETYNDEGFISELPKTSFKVDKMGKGNYMAFTVKNDSMWNEGGYDTPGGAEILGREVGRHLWAGGFHKTEYGFILLTKTGIFHKDIKDYNKDTGLLTLASRNPDVKDFTMSINDVNQVFNVIKRSY